MADVSAWRKEARELARLALPVTFVQVGMMALSVVDTMMVGRVSDVALAAVHVGHSYSFFFLAGGMGLLMALDPLVSQAFGARDDEGVARALQRGIAVALACSVPVVLAVLPAETMLAALGQDPDVVPVAAAYARWIVPGVPLFLVFVALRQTLQGVHMLRPITWSIVVANLANVVFNWAFVFGHLGFEPRGAVGAAWATSLSRGVLFAFLAWAAWPWLAPRLWPVRSGLLRGPGMRRMLWIGAPIAIQVGAEVGAFGCMTLLVGHLGETDVAGSSIVLNLAAVSFMLPLGVSVAASVRVGNAVGRGDPDAVRRAAGVALVAGPGVMALGGVLFLTFPALLARLYTPEAAVIAVAVSLLPIAAAFQLFDGAQVVATGVLRGAGDTRVPMLVHLAGFWLVGMPLGAWLGLGGGRDDPGGVWWGITAGLVVVAAVLLLRVRVRLAGELQRIDSGEGSGSAPPAAE